MTQEELQQAAVDLEILGPHAKGFLRGLRRDQQRTVQKLGNSAYALSSAGFIFIRDASPTGYVLSISLWGEEVLDYLCS